MFLSLSSLFLFLQSFQPFLFCTRFGLSWIYVSAYGALVSPAYGLGCRIWGSGFRVDLGFRV